ncbi:hypothetical protein Tco_1145492 [Tanacetum coccineum]
MLFKFHKYKVPKSSSTCVSVSETAKDDFCCVESSENVENLCPMDPLQHHVKHDKKVRASRGTYFPRIPSTRGLVHGPEEPGAGLHLHLFTYPFVPIKPCFTRRFAFIHVDDEVFPAEEAAKKPAVSHPLIITRRMEEQLSSADPAAVLLIQLTRTHTLLIASSASYLLPPPSPFSLITHPHLPQIPSPPLPIPSPPPNSPTYVEGSLGSRAAGIRQRDALPSPVHEMRMHEICFTDLVGYGITDTWDDLVGAIQEIAPTTLEGVNQRVIELATTVDQEDEIIYSQLDDARYDRALLRARVNMLYRDRPFHRRTALLMDEEARLSRAAWAQSMDACNQTRSEGISLRTTVMAQQSEITELQAADRRRQTVISDLLKADHRRQRQLVEALKIVKSLKTQMIELQRQQGPAKDPAEPELPEEASSSS